ncbi:MAG: hypothetical protein EU536_01370 [Promethearchaeota archaeon]|nr:MAG: hypothetical protein EU536_01370 [Candidatus Lokiarchaeota archaeon]
MGKNVQFKIDGDKLIVEMNLSEHKEESKSGKSLIIASTRGNKRIFQDKDVFLGLNLYEKITQKKE